MKNPVYRIFQSLFVLFSALALAGVIYLYVDLRSVERTIPISSVTQYRNLSTTISVLFSLAADLQLAGALRTPSRMDALELSIERTRASLSLMRGTLGERVPERFAVILDEIEAVVGLLETRRAAGTFDAEAAVDLHGRLSFILAGFRDYIVGINDESILDLERQSRSMRLLGWETVLALVITLFSIATMAYLILASRRMTRIVERAKEEAVEASRAKSEFLAGMSHEIRTPLNAVTGMLHLLRKTPLTAQQAEYTERALQSSKVLLGVISDILDFSKIEAGKLELERIPFDLEEVLNGQAVLFHQKAREKNLPLRFRYPADLPTALVGDALRLSQVLLNLIGNALKFTGEGDVRVGIEAADRAEGEVTLRFSVRDTGIGLTEDQVKKLFAPFSQADRSTTRTYGGTGLGLALCRNLVDKMQGRIWVESAPGRGSTFSFTARYGLDPAGNAAVPMEAARVLLCADDPDALDLLEEHLTGASFRCVKASLRDGNVDAAVAAARSAGPFDAVLLDIDGQGIDGFAAARAVRESWDGPPPALVLAVEADGRNGDGVADVLLGKPVLPSTVRKALRDARRGSRVPAVEKPRVAACEPQPAGRGCTILLVEDNEVNRMVAAEILRGEGFAVETAENGPDALQRIADRAGSLPYQAVLMDLHMPEMDGYETTRRIRALLGDTPLPIIAMTADAVSDVQRKVIEAGMNDYVAKPVMPERLFAVLSRWIAGK